MSRKSFYLQKNFANDDFKQNFLDDFEETHTDQTANYTMQQFVEGSILQQQSLKDLMNGQSNLIYNKETGEILESDELITGYVEVKNMDIAELSMLKKSIEKRRNEEREKKQKDEEYQKMIESLIATKSADAN